MRVRECVKRKQINKGTKAENPTRRCVLRSGNNSLAGSGLAYANANNASSNSNTNYGGRLKFLMWLK